MGPEIETNLDSILRSMEHVILPALDPGHQLAQEQGQAILVYLKLIRDQHRHLLHFRLQEIREYHAMVHALRDALGAAGLPDDLSQATQHVLAASAPLLAIDLPTYSDLASTARQLRETADRLVQAVIEATNIDGEARARCTALLIEQARAEALRERSWVAQLGLDPDPGHLIPLGEIGLNKS